MAQSACRMVRLGAPVTARGPRSGAAAPQLNDRGARWPYPGAARKMGDMTELAPSLVDLARRFGIATGYADWTGRHVLVSEVTLVAVLAALGVPARDEQERNAAL